MHGRNVLFQHKVKKMFYMTSSNKYSFFMKMSQVLYGFCCADVADERRFFLKEKQNICQVFEIG